MQSLRLLRRMAHPQRLAGLMIEARLAGVVMGEICDILQHHGDTQIFARAQVVGFNRDTTVLNLIGTSQGLSRDMLIRPSGARLSVELGDALLGSVLDPAGRVVERLAAPILGGQSEMRPIDAQPVSYAERRGIRQALVTGVRAIDGMLTCGEGQRIGIFASAGGGKTSLMNMLIEHADADVFVIGLIGERGREVTEFVETLRKSSQTPRCILVYATSDFSSLDRCNAALVATTVAEYFRDRGSKVMLFLDSITRYGRALRDVALAAGEAPARRGYPASVFDALPRLLERPGLTQHGSITAFYTILLENDDEPDPIADEIRSILDGHIYLSRKLAAQNHYPAIDVLRSVSRVASQVCSPEHLAAAGAIRGTLARLEELQVFVDLGEYKSGDNADNDRAMEKRTKLNTWLRQAIDERTPLAQTLEYMHALAA
ncbi:type III secretion system ATPase SctN [Chromobacterium piscinae]|uniref:Type III secretion system ATPase SctN n=1 Tax=Chromobacterium piscinae TaxID=686831 RepID=A0ABV0H8U4_9NEIS